MRRPQSRAVFRGVLPVLAVTGLVLGLVGAPPASAAAPVGSAPGGPGAMSHFGLARKDCLGTARNTSSKVWFTVANGVLSDVYYPTIDNTNVETLQLVVTDGRTFTDLQTRDMTYTVRALDESGMACRVTSTARSGRYSLVTDYFTDPSRDAVVMRVRLDARGAKDLQVYARYDATMNGNGGGADAASANGGADDAVTDTSAGRPVPVSLDTNTSTTAANRDYAVPVYSALRANRPFRAVSSGFAGTASDGLAQLDADRRLTSTYAAATGGNVVQTAQLDVRGSGATTLALGFGTTQADAVRTAGRSASADAGDTLRSYLKGWQRYDRTLRAPAVPKPLTAAERREARETYWVSANVLKASEDKTFPGAVVASLASPWGQAVAAGDRALTYFGSYREVFARDLYESFTGLVSSGDVATAKATVRFLFERQQQADGSMPRNSLVNGRTAPDSFGVQLDEVAYPILMARTVGLTDKAFYENHLKRAADYVVAHGPSFGSERWEEQSGWSPSTIAAEIAGLAAAGAIAELNGDAVGARVYRATADHYQRNVKTWTVTTNGPLSASPYFIRLSKNADPNSALHVQPRQRRPGRRPALRRRRGLPRAAAVRRSCPRTTRTSRARSPSSTRRSGGRRAAATGSTATGRRPPAPRTATVTATYRTRPRARSRASRGPAAAPPRSRTRARATCGRCSPASGPSTRSRPGAPRRRPSAGWGCPGRRPAAGWSPSRRGRTRTWPRRPSARRRSARRSGS